MRDRTRRERWKDVGIAALALAALVMTVQLTGLPDFLRARNAGADSGAPVTDRASLLGPYAAAVTLSDGTRCGAAWGSGSQAIYERFSALLGEALGSAGNPVRATAESWREALSGPGAYFDFRAQLPLALLAEWLGAQTPEWDAGDSAGELVLALEDNAVRLYYRSGEAWYSCATALNGAVLTERLGEFSPNGAVFAFEAGEDYALVEDTVLLYGSRDTLQNYTVRTPLQAGQSAAELLAAFGMNSYMANSYTEADGADIYVEGTMSLRLSGDGTVRFWDTEPAAGELSPAAAAELAARTVQSALEETMGAAELRLWSLEYRDTGYTVQLCYCLDGVPVLRNGAPCAAKVEITGTDVSWAEITGLEFTASGGTEAPMPPELEAALVQSAGGGSMEMWYQLWNDQLRADWVTA